jgi:hypothetical protein
MKRTVIFLIALLIAGTEILCQQNEVLSKGDFGLFASFDGSSSTIGCIFHITNELSIFPEIGISKTSEDYTSATSALIYPSTWFSIGSGLYYNLYSKNNFYIDFGPKISQQFNEYKSTSNNNTYKYSYFRVDLNIIVKAMITNNIGVTSSFGGYFYNQNTKDLTVVSNYEKTISRFGTQSLDIGICLYIK